MAKPSLPQYHHSRSKLHPSLADFVDHSSQLRVQYAVPVAWFTDLTMVQVDATNLSNSWICNQEIKPSE